MKKQFYSHIVEVETIYVALDGLTLSDGEKNHLKEVIDTNMYHTILDVVLSELPEQDRKMFLDKLAEDDHEKTMDFLQKRILNIEDKIKRVAKELVSELHQDVKETKAK